VIVTRTPLRISFFGGGTDYPSYYLKNGGQTLGATMDKFTYITVKRLPEFAEHRIRASYSIIEECQSIDEIEHPSIRECLRYMEIDGPIEISVVADLPSRTGIGSSSSFTVGLLHALHAAKGTSVSNFELASQAVHVEQNLIKEQVGVQDQFTTTFGGIQHLQFGTDASISTTNVEIDQERRNELSNSLMLFYTGVRRHASPTLDEQLQKTQAGQIDEQLTVMSSLVNQGLDILQGSFKLQEFGDLLHQSWTLKKELSSKISSPQIDEMYDKAMSAGASGGKLMGAGSGGFLLACADAPHRQNVMNALSEYPLVEFNLETEGSQVVLSDSHRPEFA